jgi:osmotically-inducible protein OsmY
MSSIRPFLLGVITGAGALYLLDPVMGRTRRKQAADQAIGAAHTAQDQIAGKVTQAGDRAMGAISEALPDEAPANDQTLVAKVRSEVLGNADWADYSLNVDAADGVVTLRGEVASIDHRDAIVEAVEGVTGVEQVSSLLHLPGETPENVKPSRRPPARTR